MSKIGARLWSRRQLLKNSGVISAVGAAASLAPSAASAAATATQVDLHSVMAVSGNSIVVRLT
jgi:hypothetical protein